MYNEQLNDLIQEANSKGYIFKDGKFIAKEYEDSKYTIVLEIYYRYESEYESYGQFWVGRKFVELNDTNESNLCIRNEQDFINFLEDNRAIPDIVFEKIEESCWEFSDEYGKNLKILDDNSLKNYCSNLQYENENGYKEEMLSEVYFSDNNFDSYFSIFKTDKETAKRLTDFNIETDFKKYLRSNGPRL